MWVIGLVLFCALLGGLGQVFFKLSSDKVTFNILSWILNWKLIVGIILYATATILFVYALKHGNLNILYPIIATSYVWVTIFSILFLREPFSHFKWLGVLLIIFGVGLIVR
jgi:undecaprenyl phosphate-alpha-L-ara4N flippase subunit ArnE